MPLVTALGLLFTSRAFLGVILTRLAVAVGVQVVTMTGLAAIGGIISNHISSGMGSVSGFALYFINATGVVAAANFMLAAILASGVLRAVGGVYKAFSLNPGATGAILGST